MHRDGSQIILSPSDLTTFLGCRHATALDLRALDDITLVRTPYSDLVKLLHERGRIHEQDYLTRLQSSGCQVVAIPADASRQQRVAQTLNAMRAGADVIYQGAFRNGRWHGYADFLERTNTASTAWTWSYQPVDTKLSVNVQPSHAVQLSRYADLLAAVQGTQPGAMAVVLGYGQRENLDPRDYCHYVRYAAERLEAFVDAAPTEQTQSEPCAACAKCHWSDRRKAEWETADHLTYVANIRKSQIAKLRAAGVNTLTELGALPSLPTLSAKPSIGGLTAATYER